MNLPDTKAKDSMKNELQDIWFRLTEVFPREQSLYILIYCGFAGYLVRYTGKFPEKEDFLQEKTLARLVEPEDYDLREAFWTLERNIDWVYFDEFPAAKRLKDYLAEYFMNLAPETAEEMNRYMNIIQEFAAAECVISCTPASIGQLIGEIACLSKADSIADYCCGFSGLGLEVREQMEKQTGNSPDFYAVDINRTCCAVSLILLWLNQIENYEVKNRNILETEEGAEQKYDLIVADIPKGMNESFTVKKSDERFRECPRKSVYADWIFIMDALNHLSENGRLFLIATKGTLARRNEKELREWVVARHYLEGVITLPANMYFDTNMSMELMIFHKKKERPDKIFFGDISPLFIRKNRNRNEITPSGIELLLKSYRGQESTDKSGKIIGRWVESGEVKRADYTFNPLIYLELARIKDNMTDSIVLGDVAQIIRGVQLSKEDEEELRRNPTHYLLGIREIEHGEIRYNEENRIRRKNIAWETKYAIREDDIILTSKGSLVKMALVYPNPKDAYIMGNLTIIRANARKYHPYVLYEFLTSGEGKKCLESIQTGSTIKVLNVTQLQKMRIPVYRTGSLYEYGEKLKENEIRYREEMGGLTAKYQKRKEELMKKVEQEDKEDEENIYQS